MDLAHIGRVFWAASFFGDLALLAVLFYRRRARQFPAFTTLMIFNAVRTIALFFILQRGTAPEYFYTYWCLAVVDTGIQFAVGYEVAAIVFRPMGEWAVDIRNRLLLWFVASLVVAIGLIQLQQPSGPHWFESPILKGSFFSATLLSELFVGMIALSSIAGLNWRSHVARIAEGLAVYSFSNILIETSNTVFGFGGGGQIYNTLQTVRKGLYVICVTYWSITLWRDAPQARRMTKHMEDQVSAIREALGSRLDILNSETKR
jgi:hypothetical protein